MEPLRGTLYLVPNTLDFGTAGPAAELADLLPRQVLRIAARLEHWIVENAKTTRAFLKRVDAVEPLGRPLQQIVITELAKPRKGGGSQAIASFDATALLEPASLGADIGLLSEAGLPGVADPGAAVVAAAHAARLRVVALPGASSLSLALAASGLDGQSFAFVGYVPIEATARAARIRELEGTARRLGQTQLMIETPYRNGALLDSLLEHLHPTTRLSVSCGLTLDAGWSRTDTVAGWRRAAIAMPADMPAVYALLAK